MAHSIDGASAKIDSSDYVHLCGHHTLPYPTANITYNTTGNTT